MSGRLASPRETASAVEQAPNFSGRKQKKLYSSRKESDGLRSSSEVLKCGKRLMKLQTRPAISVKLRSLFLATSDKSYLNLKEDYF